MLGFLFYAMGLLFYGLIVPVAVIGLAFVHIRRGWATSSRVGLVVSVVLSATAVMFVPRSLVVPILALAVIYEIVARVAKATGRSPIDVVRDLVARVRELSQARR